MLSRRGPLRIAWFVPPSEHFAGIERVVHEIACGVAAGFSDRIEVHVVFASRYDEALLADPPYRVHVLDVGHLRRLAPALRAVVARERIDVLVCPQVEASVVAWLATRGLGLPALVPHLHGNPRIEEADGTRRTRAAFAVFRHLVARRSAGVLAVSPSLAGYARTHVARRAPRVLFARNPMRALPPAAPRVEDDGGPRFLGVGRLMPQKGQDLLLRAFSAARADLPGARLTLVGSGPDEPALRALRSELGLDDVVDLAGYCTDPGEHFARADCLVLPSRWEGFGMVLVEGLHFGLPLLAADCEFGPADVVTDEGIGLLVPPDDVAALADGLRRAARRRPDAGDEARRRAVAAAHGRAPAAAEQVAALELLLAGHPALTHRLGAPVPAGR